MCNLTIVFRASGWLGLVTFLNVSINSENPQVEGAETQTSGTENIITEITVNKRSLNQRRITDI